MSRLGRSPLGARLAPLALLAVLAHLVAPSAAAEPLSLPDAPTSDEEAPVEDAIAVARSLTRETGRFAIEVALRVLLCARDPAECGS